MSDVNRAAAEQATTEARQATLASQPRKCMDSLPWDGSFSSITDSSEWAKYYSYLMGRI